LRTAASVLENGRNFSRARDVTGGVWKCQSGLDRRKKAEEKAAVKKTAAGEKRRKKKVAVGEAAEEKEAVGAAPCGNLTLSLVPE
jgi:hypothetical protein